MLQAGTDRAEYRAVPARPSLRETVYYLLRRRITDLAATAAAPVVLHESHLARSLGVSRTPVREALSRLVEEGILTSSHRRGVQVVPTSLDLSLWRGFTGLASLLVLIYGLVTDAR